MKLPGYETLELIREGTSTVIYRARSIRDNTIYILKALKFDYPALHEVEQLQHEYRVAHSLDIDGIVQPHALERHGHRLVLILEDFGGVPLRSLIDNGPLDIGQFLTIAHRIATTLALVHCQNVIHRDIKPANILLNTTTGVVKLTDFGIAGYIESASPDEALSLRGTLAYISPEQTGRTNRTIDHRTDLYALGVTFYEMLTAQLPFETTDPLELVHAHLARQPTPPIELRSDIPLVLSEMILKLLAKTAEERYQDADSLANDLAICQHHWQEHGKITAFSIGNAPTAVSPQTNGSAAPVPHTVATVARTLPGQSALSQQYHLSLVRAEQARVLGQIATAIENYDQAIQAATEQDALDEAALAHEMAARFYLGIGRVRIGQLYISESYYIYRRIGANEKAQALARTYPHLIKAETALSSYRENQHPLTTITTSSSTSAQLLDLNTVLKAAQAFSSEIELETLIKKVIGIVLANAGAERGFLVLHRDDGLHIEAEAEIDQDRVTVPRCTWLDNCRRLAPTIVRHVYATTETLVLAHAVTDERFKDDPYIQAARPKSILCVPIINRGNVGGVIYLENNLGIDAFSPDRIEMTHMLATHAAISLENARLYENTKREVAERIRAEEALRYITEGTASVTGGDFFRSLVSYLTTAFDVNYALVAECTDQTATRVRTLAYMVNQDFHENIEYELEGTPCINVVGGDVYYCPAELNKAFPRYPDLESYLGVPIYNSAGIVVGHLCVIDDKPMNRTPYDISMLEIFAARTGAELERKQAEEALLEREETLRHLNEQLEDYNRNLERKVEERTREIERRREVSAGLHDLLTILNSSRSLDEILDYILQQANVLLRSESGAIYRHQEEQQMFVHQISRGLPMAYVDQLTLPVHHSFIGQAMLSRQPIVVKHPSKQARDFSIPLDEERYTLLAQYQTLLCVPLIRQGDDRDHDTTYGGIALYYEQERQFQTEEIELAVAFADQATLAIENARLRQQVKQVAVREERGRLARELHDSVTQSLYSLTLLAEGWRRLARDGRLADVTEPLAELGGIGQQALKEMRLLVHELRPPALEREGLLGALHERLASVERRAGVDARLIANDMLELPAYIEEELYRITQEALNNALKHAEATSITVRIDADTEQIELEIVDNGCGFQPNQLPNKGGIGLHSMRERADQLGAHLAIESQPHTGTTVRVSLKRTDAERAEIMEKTE